jgi:ssDNA-binding Zn-finger/Zn-ribbon topoisomerase 1
MPDPLSGPIGFIPGQTGLRAERYANPFYGIPLQYIPQNMDHMLWWADHFLLRFGFYKSVLSRIGNYFITELNVECEDSQAKDRYKEIFKELNWKQVLSKAGLNLLAYGNVFMSINRGFTRFLICPKCQKTSNIEKINDYKFTGKNGKFIYKCPSCAYEGVHKIVDKPTKDVKKTNVTFWPPREIKVRYEETTGEAEYYWDIPQEYIKQVTQKNNTFFSKKTPKVIYDAIIQERLLAFNDKNFIHLKVPGPVGIKTGGKAIPFCIYLFDDFFMLKVLQRFNEAICFEDIAPFRVIAMSSDSNPQANPILTQNAAQWQAAVQRMITEHRRDPGSYHTFPFPLAYEQLGGKGKDLAPVEIIQQAVGNILNALNIPQELYTMNLQTQAIGPALRLFENSWTFVVDTYNDLLNHWADIIGKIQGLPAAKVSLLHVTLSDDMERKSIIGQLVSANAIARSEMLNLFGFDYKEQLRKKNEEDSIAKELQEEQAAKDQLKQLADTGGMGPQAGSSPQDVLSQAQEKAQELFPLEPHERRAKLQEIKAQDETLWGATKAALQELTSQAKSQGVQGTKQQMQQPGAQQ